jgi:hypothetical protein
MPRTVTIDLRQGISAFDEVIALHEGSIQRPRTRDDGLPQRVLSLGLHRDLAKAAKRAALANPSVAGAASNQAAAGAPRVETVNWCDTVFFLDFEEP